MPKTQITSSKIRKPSGHFSQATSIAVRGHLVFISGMTARCADGTIAGIGDAPIDVTSDLYINLVEALHDFGDPQFAQKRCLRCQPSSAIR